MAKTWANLGRDLHLDLSRTRVRSALEAALRDAIRDGRLAPGTMLPSSRTLAQDLGVARNTVADAYGQLGAEGWLSARQGSGTRVAARPAMVDSAPSPHATERHRCPFDLTPGSPNLSDFPRSAWLAAMRRALAAAPYEALGYGDARGRLELRAALSEYLARARGVDVTPERVVVCSGLAQGLDLLCEMLRARGARTIATEAYGYPAQHELIAASGLVLRPLPVDSGGSVVDQLAGEDAVLLTPAHQFPIGVPLRPQRRTQVVAWAAETGGLVIEDDYDGEFRFDRQAVGAMQALAPEHVIYAGTASKSLAPGLRLGWLVLPSQIVDEFVAVKTRSQRSSSALEQLALAEFIASGAYDRHVRRSRLTYRRRRERIVAALTNAAPNVRIIGLAAGLHLLVELPPGHCEQDTIARAAQHGLALDGVRTYSAHPGDRGPALVIGYGTPPDHAFTGAVSRLCAVLEDSPHP